MRIFSSVHHRGRSFSSVAVILITLLWPGRLVNAVPVSINEVVQIISNHQNGPELRLRALTQLGNTAIWPLKAASDSSANKRAAVAKPATDSLFSGGSFQTDQRPANVVVVNQGDVEGTICDCGEILVAGGGFPKWPLLFLAAIPFFFIDRDNSTSIGTLVPTPPAAAPTPTPIPPPAAIPEPASLILFVSGLMALGVGFRRRRAKIKAAAPAQGTEGS